jgi:DNA-binding transcriptional regulator YiaG
LTPDAYRNALEALGLSQVKAARLLGVNDRTSRTWAAEGAPPSVAVALAALVFIKGLGLDPLALPAIQAASQAEKKAPGA